MNGASLGVACSVSISSSETENRQWESAIKLQRGLSKTTFEKRINGKDVGLEVFGEHWKHEGIVCLKSIIISMILPSIDDDFFRRKYKATNSSAGVFLGTWPRPSVVPFYDNPLELDCESESKISELNKLSESKYFLLGIMDQKANTLLLRCVIQIRAYTLRFVPVSQWVRLLGHSITYAHER